MVLLTGVVFIASAGSTVAVRVAGESVLEPIGLGALTGPLLGVVTPIALAFLVLGALLRLVPAEPIPWSGVWRGAAGGAIAVWALATAFGVYVDNFGRYNALYGSLGAAAALLAFVFLAAIVLLATAAAAAHWPEVAAADQPERTGPAEPVSTKVRRALVGLVVRR
jgi:membrane protein